MRTNRRSFIKKTAIAGTAPFILPSGFLAAETKPNDRLTMGFIGMGKQSYGLLGGFLGRCRVLAVCDVDTTRREHARKRVDDYYKKNPKKGSAGCDAYNDFRKIIDRDDIDLVCIATPDHWHAIPTLAALRSGKDVYCEKPLTHNIHEAIEVMKAVPANNRVLQTGSMQRSMQEFRVACELVRNGAIGRLEKIECSFGPPGRPCDLPAEEMEPGLDWDLWLGPAHKRPYNSILSPRGVHNHYPHWRNYKEFGGGMVTDWGAHHLDIAQWGLGMDDSGPVKIVPPPNKDDEYGATLVYADGVPVIHKKGNNVCFYGTEGVLNVNRGRFELVHNGETISKYARGVKGTSMGRELLKAKNMFLQDPEVKLYNSRNHLDDFLDAVKSRKKPITSEQVGGRAAICCHLMNQAYYNHATIEWDPKAMRFANGTGDPAWLTRDYRQPWVV